MADRQLRVSPPLARTKTGQSDANTDPQQNRSNQAVRYSQRAPAATLSSGALHSGARCSYVKRFSLFAASPGAWVLSQGGVRLVCCGLGGWFGGAAQPDR